ncbi:MAG: hypothetical protein HMLKMBBP_00358 [Planctomycetes bacterium]|nr:hypothetical protein [Planctomycetota bacterium]
MDRRRGEGETVRPIVAVVYAELTQPVVLAQSPPLLRAWRDAGRKVDAALFTSPRALLIPSDSKAHASAAKRFEEAIGHEPMRKTYVPRDRGFDALGRALAARLRERGMLDAVLLCRQPRAALVGIEAKRALGGDGKDVRVVHDMRGVRDEEYLTTLGKPEVACTPDEKKRLDTYRRHEAEACRGADLVLTVSGPMERTVIQRHGLADEKIEHVPNHTGVVAHAETHRAEVRRELGVPDDALLFVYSGTLAAWQLPARSALLFQACRLHRQDARMLFLTTDTAAAEKAAKSAGLMNGIFRSVTSDRVARHLCAADYGLLLREETLVNRVSCPVKFGEYLACGVRPVMTSNIGDQSRVAMERNLGVVIGLVDPVAAAKQVALDMQKPRSVDADGRALRRAWAEENVSPARIAARIAAFVDG